MDKIHTKQKNKVVKDTCKKMTSWGCKVVEVYISLFTGDVIITFIHEKIVYDIFAHDIKDTIEETLQFNKSQSKPKKQN